MSTLVAISIGIALGAAFTPFWVKVWGWIKGEAKVVESKIVSAPVLTVTPTATAVTPTSTVVK